MVGWIVGLAITVLMLVLMLWLIRWVKPLANFAGLPPREVAPAV